MVLYIRQLNVLAQIPQAPLGMLTSGTKVVILPDPPMNMQARNIPTLRAGRLAWVRRAENNGYYVENLTRQNSALVGRVGLYRPAVEAQEHVWAFNEDGTCHEVVAGFRTTNQSTTLRGTLVDRATSRNWDHWVKKEDERIAGVAAVGVRVPEIPELPEYWRKRVEDIAKQYASDHGMCSVVDDALNEIFLPIKGWRVSVTADDDGTYWLLDEDGQICAYNEEREDLLKIADTLNKATR